MLTAVAPMNEEYLAMGPKVCTACDSTSPGVRENNVNNTISGINIPPAIYRRVSDIATEIIPATIPPKKNDLEKLGQYSMRIRPNLSPFCMI